MTRVLASSQDCYEFPFCVPMANNNFLQQLQDDGEIRKILAWPFDFDLAVIANEHEWFSVKPDAAMKTIARDGTGGIFLLYGAQQRLLHITSEGQAGVIARELKEGLRLIVAYPYWRDILKFSGGGRLDEMRRVIPYLERGLGNQSDIDKYRAILKQRLFLKDNGDPIASLHTAVAVLGKDITVAAPDGTEFESLFNTFTLVDNPAWRKE